MEGICVNFLDQVLFFRFLKGMATNLVAKMGQNYLPPCTYRLSIQNGMGYRYFNVRVISANDASISCKNFVNFSPVTPEKTSSFVYFFTTWQKNWHI